MILRTLSTVPYLRTLRLLISNGAVPDDAAKVSNGAIPEDAANVSNDAIPENAENVSNGAIT